MKPHIHKEPGNIQSECTLEEKERKNPSLNLDIQLGRGGARL